MLQEPTAGGMVSPNKIVRTICYFTTQPSQETVARLQMLRSMLEEKGYLVQTIRVCAGDRHIDTLQEALGDSELELSVGHLTVLSAQRQLATFLKSRVSFALDLSNHEVELRHVELLQSIMQEKAGHTFNFCYSFNGPSTPYFPAAKYEREGFAVGLQPVDLSEGKDTLEQWLQAVRKCWQEIALLFKDESDFLGIDGSTAPLGMLHGSLAGFIKRIEGSWAQAILSPAFTNITDYLRRKNPRPFGLNGLMLPLAEDGHLVMEYEKGGFSIERALFLSMHCGVGIDAYPIGIDQDPLVICRILRVAQALSKKHNKPLSVRFLAQEGKEIGQRTDFNDPRLHDCTIRPLELPV